MGRHRLCRRVDNIPLVTYFKPAGVPLRNLQEICLCVEETEAIRLKDIEELEQEECAQKMSVSRPTFARILVSARRKVADALLNGKAIRIEGGSFEMAQRRFRCHNSHEWDVPFEVMVKKTPLSCPKCYSRSISPLFPEGISGLDREGRGGYRIRRGFNSRRAENETPSVASE